METTTIWKSKRTKTDVAYPSVEDGVMPSDWSRKKPAEVRTLPARLTRDVPYLLSEDSQEFVLALNQAVYGAEGSVHDDDEEPPYVPFAARQAAAELVMSLARFIAEESHAPWVMPQVSVVSDGRLALQWTSGGKRVIVYVPPSEDGQYVIVTKSKGTAANRTVESKDRVDRHVKGILCNREEPFL